LASPRLLWPHTGCCRTSGCALDATNSGPHGPRRRFRVKTVARRRLPLSVFRRTRALRRATCRD
jgi:hypothetical protein